MQNGNELEFKMSGSLDNSTAKQLEKELGASLDGITSLIFDFSELEYISSAGLRVMLSTQKKMKNQGDMVIRGANSTITEVFEITGFAPSFTFEDV